MGRSERIWEVAVVACLLLALAGQASAEPPAADSRLSATLVGRLEPGATGRLAVRWDGSPGALLDAWVDLDGDGQLSPEELVVNGRPLVPGIEVVSFDLAPAGQVVPEPEVWVEARTVGVREVEEGATAGTSAESRDGCAWQPGFTVADLNSTVDAMIVFDDGSGPALYVGGWFTAANGSPVNGIARWDGGAWSTLSGPSGTGVSGGNYTSVRALAVFDDGTGPALYAGGQFTTAGGVTANSIARWDGAAWSALSGPSGTGTSKSVWALAVFDDGSGPALYVGGWFATAGGVTANNIARWDGTAWSALIAPSGTGVSSYVWDLAVFNDGTGPALYAGGDFATAGGVTVSGIARWSGSSWSALSGPSGTGVSGGSLRSLAVYDDGTGAALYAGGFFDTAGGVTVNGIARWSGSSWSALSGPSGTGVAGAFSDSRPYVGALAVFDDGTGPALYAGGSFTIAGGVTVNGIARWDGSSWSALAGPSGTGVLHAVDGLAVFDDGSGPALYAGGGFSAAGGVTAHCIARWDGSAWSGFGGVDGSGICGGVFVLAVFDDGSGPALYAGGSFTIAGGVTVNNVARWDGSGWSPLSGPSGTGVSGGSVSALAVFDDGSGPALYAGGNFTTAGGVTVNNVARWDGSGWSDLSGPSGTGVSGGSVSALAVFDDGSGPALFAGGNFATAGGVTVNNVARWDGSGWSALSGPAGTGASDLVSALAVFDDGTGPALYAGGWFTTAGGVTVNYVARWDGSGWSALSGPSGTGVSGYVVWTLAVFDDGTGPALYAGGYIVSAGGVEVYCIARWDGSGWSALGTMAETGILSDVLALAVLDDGTGPALYAGGFFDIAGGVIVNHVARWDGSTWSAFSGPSGAGTNDLVWSFAWFDDGTGPALYAGGSFVTAGGLPSSAIAVWRCVWDAIFADGFEDGNTAAWSDTVP